MAECYVVPGQPFILAVPAHTVETTDYGWNAGAISVDVLDGNVRTQFTMPKRNVGCVLGFTSEAGDVTDRNRITHGFYFYLDNVYRVRVIESGVAKTAPAAYTTDTVFKIERINGVVNYFVDGAHIFASSVPSSGPLVIGAVLYMSGDAAPGVT